MRTFPFRGNIEEKVAKPCLFLHFLLLLLLLQGLCHRRVANTNEKNERLFVCRKFIMRGN
jgi:hypothetical protein